MCDFGGGDFGSGDFSFGDFFGGSFDGWSSADFGEHGGFFESLFSGEASIIDIAGDLWERYGAASEEVLNDFLTFRFYQNYTNNPDETWESFKKNGAKLSVEQQSAKDVLESHSLLKQLVSKYLPQDNEVRIKYEALGAKLPDEALLKQTKKQLSSKLHPDRAGGDSEIMKKANASLTLLENKEACENYNHVTNNGVNTGDLFEEFCKTDREDIINRSEKYKADRVKMFKGIEGKAREEMGFSEKISADINNFFKKASPTTQGGVIFGVITGTALLTFLACRWQDQEKHKKQTKNNASSLAI